MFACYVFTSCSYKSVLLVFPLPLNIVSDELYECLNDEGNVRKILTCGLRIELRIVKLEGESAISTYTNQLPSAFKLLNRRGDFSSILRKFQTVVNLELQISYNVNFTNDQRTLLFFFQFLISF
ncbi:hypothetical protein ACFFRR_009007 [Megaselia abdita]